MKRTWSVGVTILLVVGCSSVPVGRKECSYRYNGILDSQTRTIDTHAQEWNLYLDEDGLRKLVMKAFVVEGRITGLVPTCNVGDVPIFPKDGRPKTFHFATPSFPFL